MLKIMLLAGLVLASVAVAAPKTLGVTIVKEWKGWHSSQLTPKQVVAQDQKEWEAIWSIIQGNVQPKPETPKIDFDKHQVVAVFMGSRSSTAYRIKIVSIKEEGSLVVTVQERSPRRRAVSLTIMTAPYHAVVIPKTDKAVKFVIEKTE